MTALPGDIVLQSPWRPRSLPLLESPAAKKSRTSIPAVSLSSKNRGPGSAAAAVDWGELAKVHVSVSPPRQPAQAATSHEHATLEVDVDIAPFACVAIDSVPVSEISRLTREALSVMINLDAYPKSVISIRVVVLQVRNSNIANIVPAVILASTSALETADLSLRGRIVATSYENEGVSCVTAFDLASNRLALLNCIGGAPDLSWGLSAARQLEKDMISASFLKPRIVS